MTRLIYVPQIPVKMRYQEWYYQLFPSKLHEHFDEVIVLGPKNLKSGIDLNNNELFSDARSAIGFEGFQIQEFLEMDIKDTDTLLLGDLSYPGFFTNALFHKPMKNAYAICHGTSKNKYDIFSSTQKQKWLVETGHSKLFKKIFVASEYHKRKLGWDNVIVAPFPYPNTFITFDKKPIRKIISVTRPGLQKVNKKLEKRIEKEFNLTIHRRRFDDWFNYYQYISNSQILLSTAKEETFGYQIVDAILGGTIPIAPNKFSYPELLPKDYLYDDEEDLYRIINLALNGKLRIPRILLCENQMIDFFNKISEVMKREN